MDGSIANNISCVCMYKITFFRSGNTHGEWESERVAKELTFSIFLIPRGHLNTKNEQTRETIEYLRLKKYTQRLNYKRNAHLWAHYATLLRPRFYSYMPCSFITPQCSFGIPQTMKVFAHQRAGACRRFLKICKISSIFWPFCHFFS